MVDHFGDAYTSAPLQPLILLTGRLGVLRNSPSPWGHNSLHVTTLPARRMIGECNGGEIVRENIVHSITITTIITLITPPWTASPGRKSGAAPALSRHPPARRPASRCCQSPRLRSHARVRQLAPPPQHQALQCSSCSLQAQPTRGSGRRRCALRRIEQRFATFPAKYIKRALYQTLTYRPPPAPRTGKCWAILYFRIERPCEDFNFQIDAQPPRR
jgi:hypothetical protein